MHDITVPLAAQCFPDPAHAGRMLTAPSPAPRRPERPLITLGVSLPTTTWEIPLRTPGGDSHGIA